MSGVLALRPIQGVATTCVSLPEWAGKRQRNCWPENKCEIFSDGTGQAGGVTFDENRTNIYKLFRATRCGPDSSIDPAEQVAFYDPGLGSPRDNHFTFGWVGRKLYNLISQGTGFGITANIIDCYAALIRLWQPG